MEYECLGITGYAGDRTPEAMLECHKFTTSFAHYFGFQYELVGVPSEPKDLNWNDALTQSSATFKTVKQCLKRVFADNRQPILITPRCATAIASLPIIMSEYPDVVVLYFDAHGDLNTPTSSGSGYLGGMPITAALGEWDSGYGAGLNTKNLVHIGGRDFECSEKAFIKRNHIFTISKQDLESKLDKLRSVISKRSVFVHLDTDVYDPSEVMAEYAVVDGLSRQHVSNVIDLVLANAQLVGLEITELSPKNDEQRHQSYSALFESFHGLKLR